MRFRKRSTAARTLAFDSACEASECARLRYGHYRAAGQRSTVGIMAVCDPADGVPQNLETIRERVRHRGRSPMLGQSVLCRMPIRRHHVFHRLTNTDPHDHQSR